MADKDAPQSNGVIPLDGISPMPLRPQSPAPPERFLNTTASPNRAAPQAFHLFSELPTELRITIWELSLPHRVHIFPRPSKKFDFFNNRWTQEQVYGPKADKRPAIAHVCSEARNVALTSGSSKKILLSGYPRTRSIDHLSRVWVDSERDTAVINVGESTSPFIEKLRRSHRRGFFYDLIRSRDMHIALDSSWGLHFCMISKNQARKLYYELVRGRQKCDFIVLDLQLDVTAEEAASTGLFGNLGASDSVLIPIEDTRQMSRLFDAQVKFDTTDWLKKWENFTQIRKPTNLEEFIRRWKKLAAREKRQVQKGLDYLTDVEVGREGKNADEIEQQIARARVIRAGQPKLRPVIMVSRGHRGPAW